jgi:hypothetical protein
MRTVLSLTLTAVMFGVDLGTSNYLALRCDSRKID